VTTSVAARETLPLDGMLARPARSYWRDAWHRFRHDWLAMGGIVFLILLGVICFSAPLISAWTGYEPQRTNLLERNQWPSGKHWFGTDEFGRDYFVRTVYAGQVSLTLGLVIAAIELLIGVPFGLLAGYFGGRTDDTLSAVISYLDCIPRFFVLILLSAWVPPTLWTLALIIAVFGWTGTSRQVRGVVFSTRQRDFVEAARALGASNLRIMYRHLLPNVMSIVLVVAGFSVAGGIVAESGLSYLGLGIRPPTPSWGNMLQNSLSYMNRSWYLIVFPGACIVATTLAIFLAFQGLRDALDPRLRGAR